jgi:NAD(P)-dependent dehydrogenase (short-subunit alcohol dehydrogenase family)
MMTHTSKHRFCIVTGASSGIGQAIARGLQDHGYRILGMQRTGAGINVDLSDIDALPRVWTQVIADHGLPDTVVLNAGASLELPFIETQIQTARRLIELNLVATLVLAQQAIGSWAAANHPGHIIIIGSQAALPGAKQIGNVFYTASKGALHAAIGPLAMEHGPRVRVNCIAPGDVETTAEIAELQRKAGRLGTTLAQLQGEVATRAALRRWVRAEEIAQAVMFLDRCEAMTGAIVNVSCGTSVH